MLLNRERAYEIMAAHNLAGLVASRPHNVTYLTGYERTLGFALHPPVRAVISAQRDAPIVLIIPPVELTTIASQPVWADEIETCGEFWVSIPDENVLTPIETRFRDLWHAKAGETRKDPLAVLAGVLKRLGMEHGRVGLDEAGIGYALRDAQLEDIVPLEGETFFREIRLIKTPDEITLLQQSALINEQAGKAMYDACVPGAAWDDIKRLYEVELARRGAIQQFFSSAPGKESSMIFQMQGHGKNLVPGEWVRHDYGGTYHSYWSDTGRTVSLGEPNARLKSYYEACLRGMLEIENALGPGARSGDLFELGVHTVRKAGIPHYDRSHCGHCIGLEMYEAGGIRPQNDMLFAPGMVINVELPYYELGWGGLQIEDTFLITATGAERLTQQDRALIVN